jgi:hypothetical protein
MQRSRVGQDAGISDQQLDTTSIDHCHAAQEPPPSGVVLQIAQATSAHQAFFGHEQNAVKTQIGCAVPTYALIAIVKKELHLNASL